MLDLVLEHAQVFAKPIESPELVVELDLQRPLSGLRYLADGRGRLVIDVIAADQLHNVCGPDDDARVTAVAIFAVLFVGDLRAAPLDDLPDVAEAYLGELFDDPLNRDAGLLSPGLKQFLYAGSNLVIPAQARGVAVALGIAGGYVGGRS